MRRPEIGQQRSRSVITLNEDRNPLDAQNDLVAAAKFYERQGAGLGEYFLNSLYSDAPRTKIRNFVTKDHPSKKSLPEECDAGTGFEVALEFGGSIPFNKADGSS